MNATDTELQMLRAYFAFRRKWESQDHEAAMRYVELCAHVHTNGPNIAEELATMQAGQTQ